MKPQAVLLMVLGVMLGPFYYAYCVYLSGTPAETHSLTERANRWELPDGSILRLKSGLGYKPLPLRLDPEMNRYRARLTFDVASGQSAPVGARNTYQLSVLQGDTAIFERSFQVDADKPGQQSVSLDALEVFYPGSYLLLLEEIGTPPLAVTAVRLELLQKVDKPQMWLVWSAMVLLLFGAAVQIRELIAPGGQRPPRLFR